MNTKNTRRAAFAGAVAALLATGAGVTAIGTGAIALDGSSAGAAIVTHVPGKLSVQLTAAETRRAAYQAGNAETICSGDPWLAGAPLCAKSVKECATQTAAAGDAMLLTMFTDGLKLGCEPAS